MDKHQSSSSRILNVKTSDDKLEAYITISYVQAGVSHKENPTETMVPVYKAHEIRQELAKLGIVYGIIDENLEKCTSEKGIKDMLIAQGRKPVSGEDDIIHLKFEIDNDIKKLNEDSRGRVDFKSIGAVKSVRKGEVIAVKQSGSEGIDGTNVFGKPIRHKSGKRLHIKAAAGCELLDENTVAASIDGKPCMKNNSLYVYKTHEIAGDVDLKTGNIIFSEDIIVQGSVKEGMKVQAGNSITIKQNVEMASITGKGDIVIDGNVITSKVFGGGEDSERLLQIKNLSSFETNLKELIAAVEEIKKLNLLGQDLSDGQIIKLLIENKFKSLYKLCLEVLSSISVNLNKKQLQEDVLFNLIKSKLIGLQPLTIKHYSELINITDIIKEKKETLKSSLALPVNVKIGYLQDSVVSSSGDIIISGKGSYLSSLVAHGGIYFVQDKSALRGGVLRASKEIKCKTIGSQGGAQTKLSVDEGGHIWVEKAYENTAFAVGKREFVLEYASKNIHVYIDDKHELIVDRLKL